MLPRWTGLSLVPGTHKDTLRWNMHALPPNKRELKIYRASCRETTFRRMPEEPLCISVLDSDSKPDLKVCVQTGALHAWSWLSTVCLLFKRATG